jgi:hypothetical protein
MRIIAFPICAVLMGVGALFLGQGMGYIPGSFMTGSGVWAAIGLLMIAAGLAILVFVARRGSS